MSSTEIRGRVAVDANVPNMADGFPVDARAFVDGTLSTMPWDLLKVLEGKVYQIQIGAEDAPVNSTAAIDDELVWAVVDVSSASTMIIPIYAEVHVATWTTATLINVMLEADDAKARYSSGGTAFTPLNLHTGSSNTSACTAYVNSSTDAGVTVSAKTSGGSIEFARLPIGEDAKATATADEKYFVWKGDVCPPVIQGAGSLLLHFGATTADVTGYGLLRWIELTV